MRAASRSVAGTSLLLRLSWWRTPAFSLLPGWQPKQTTPTPRREHTVAARAHRLGPPTAAAALRVDVRRLRARARASARRRPELLHRLRRLHGARACRTGRRGDRGRHQPAQVAYVRARLAGAPRADGVVDHQLARTRK